MSPRVHPGGFARLAGLTVLLVAAPTVAAAQIDAESFARLGFNFSPPGAQSAALGGAYIALAKDATAAETNPAALTVLLEPEIAVEFKGVEYSRTLPAVAGGGDFSDQVAIPSFASVVFPTSAFTVAAFRHELVNYRNTVWSAGFERSPGVFLNPFTSVLDMRVVNLGGALAVRSGPLSIGVSGGVSQLDLLVDFPRYRIADFSEQYLRNRLSVDQSGSSFFVNGGLLVEAGEMLTLGAVYKFRGEFTDIGYDLQERATDGTITTSSAAGVLDIPDAFGGGLAIAPNETLRISVDAVYNLYSQLSKDVQVVFSGAAADDYVSDDAIDVHAGVELLTFVGDTPLFLRGGGALLAPSNTFYTGLNPVERDLWGTSPSGTETQVSGGFGLVLMQRVALDAAVVSSSQRTEVAVSAQIYLGGQ